MLNRGIGIDLGVKDLAIGSDKNIYTQKIKKLEKKKRRLQRKISRKYLINKKCTQQLIKTYKKL